MRPVRAPAASTVRFALLVAAVLATSVFIFLNVTLHLPGHLESLNASLQPCTAPLDADPAYRSGPHTLQEAQRVLRELAQWRSCMRPALVDQTVAVVAAVAVLFGLAGLAWLGHPWWIVRRRRLRRLTATTSPRLVDYLDGLCREMGLSRAPRWLLAPYHRTSGGQAFGLPGRRYVQLDAGLLVRYAIDRPAFRAVVLHELAHLKNRDVDKTYLTISIWRAFLLAAVLPYIVLLAHPMLLRAPLTWDWSTSVLATAPDRAAYLVGCLLVLTSLVYLTRNAVLRVREIHADATAAAQEGARSALPAVLERLPAPARDGYRWWTRWGTHPDPAHRLAVVRDPGLLLRMGLWELAAVGVAGGMVCANLLLLVGQFIGFDPVLGVGIVGFAAGVPMGGMLAVGVWRATAADPARPPSARTWLVGPLVLVAGFVAGSSLSLDTVSSLTAGASGGSSAPLGSRAVSTLLLSAGAVLLTVWTGSAARTVLDAPHPRRWAMPAVVLVAAVAAAAAFAVWLPYASVPYQFTVRWGDPPATGTGIGWYRWLTGLAGSVIDPAYRLVGNPLTLPSLALMCLVPVLAGIGGWRRPSTSDGRSTSDGAGRVPVRRALVPALIGAAVTVAVGVALPLLAPAVLPPVVRRDPPRGVGGDPFYLVLSNVTAVGIIATVAVVMAVVVVRNERHRPVLALLAGLLTTVLATVGVYYVVLPAQCYTNVWSLDPPPRDCFRAHSSTLLSDTAHFVIVYAVILAVPVVLLTAAAVRALPRRRRTPPAEVTAPRPAGLVLTVVVAAVLVAATVWLTWAILPAADQTWLSTL